MRGFTKVFVVSFVFWNLVFGLSSPKVSATTVFNSWASTSSLPYPVASQTSFSLESKVFVLSGATSSVVPFQSSSHVSNIGFLDPWVVDKASPPIFWHGQAIHDNYIYLIGGATYPPTVVSDKVYLSTISGNDISSWTQLPHTLLEPRALPATAVVGDTLYVMGGHVETPSFNAKPDIYKSSINPDGSLGGFTSAGLLPEALTGLEATNIGSYVYVIGGKTLVNGLSEVKDNVWRGEVLGDGFLGNWILLDSHLPTPVDKFQMAVMGKRIFVAGGGGQTAVSDRTFYADVDEDGNIAGWTEGAPLPNGGVCCGAAAISNGWMYVMGGVNSNGYTNTVYFSEVCPHVLPTPTETLTPTPTIAYLPTTRVIVVPGVGGSWNADAILNCKADGYDEGWSLTPYADMFYQPLYDELNLKNWVVRPFYYDWRKQIPENANKLEDFINGELVENEKTDLIGHSMGGLVGRQYVVDAGNNNRLEKMLTAGSPHLGAVLAYPAWSAGEIWNDNLLQKIAFSLAFKRCKDKSISDMTAMRSYFPSMQNVLPAFDYLRIRETGEMINVTNMDAQNNWNDSGNFVSPFYGIQMGTIVGSGRSTLNELEVRAATKKDTLLENWEDGEPVRKKYGDGDGAVLLESAWLDEASNRVISEKHEDLLSSKSGLEQVLNFLGTPGIALSGISEHRSAIVVAGIGARFELEVPSGEKLIDNRGMVSVFDPREGVYKLSIIPTDEESWVGVGRFDEDGSFEWEDVESDSPNPVRKNLLWRN